MANLPPEHEDLYKRVSQIVKAARTQVARTVNTAMVHAYWLIGREIVEVQQQGRERAGYGDELIKRLAAALTRQFGKRLHHDQPQTDAAILPSVSRRFLRSFRLGRRRERCRDEAPFR